MREGFTECKAYSRAVEHVLGISATWTQPCIVDPPQNSRLNPHHQQPVLSERQTEPSTAQHLWI